MNPWRPSGSGSFSGASVGCRSPIPGCAQLPVSRSRRANRPFPTAKKCLGAAHPRFLVVEQCGGAAARPISVVKTCRGAADHDNLTVNRSREAADHHFSAVKISRGAAPRHVSIVEKCRSAGNPVRLDHRKCQFYSDLDGFHRLPNPWLRPRGNPRRWTKPPAPPGDALSPVQSRGAREQRRPAIPSPGGKTRRSANPISFVRYQHLTLDSTNHGQ